MFDTENILTNEHNALIKDFSKLVNKFFELEVLLGEENENVAILNQSAPHFFGIVVYIMWADILMHISRLTGPSTTGRGKNIAHNLTIQRLKNSSNQASNGDLEEKIKIAVSAAKFIQEPRNKIFAHHDLEFALSQNAAGITLGSREEVSQAVTAIENVIKIFMPFPIARNVSKGGGAQELVDQLKSMFNHRS